MGVGAGRPWTGGQGRGASRFHHAYITDLRCHLFAAKPPFPLVFGNASVFQGAEILRQPVAFSRAVGLCQEAPRWHCEALREVTRKSQVAGDGVRACSAGWRWSDSPC